jgi:hypothetical protein
MKRHVFASISVGLAVAAAGLVGAVGAGAAGAGRPAARSDAAASPCGTLTTAPTYKHVIVIFMENYSYGNIVGSSSAPYINSLTKECGVASNDHNISHDSLDNYIGMTDGMTNSQLKKFDLDCLPSPSCDVTTTNLFNEMASPLSWRSFSESMPSNCDKSDSGQYATKHNPAVYYTDLKNCSTDNVPLGTTSKSALLTAFGSEKTAPSFSFVTPNLCDDMHGNLGCPSNEIKAGDTWLSKWLPLITGTTVYKADDTAIFLTWDEGLGGTVGENCATNKTDQSCHVLLVAIAPSVKAGTVDSAMTSHYSLLKTIEDIFSVPEIGLAKSALSLKTAFNL